MTLDVQSNTFTLQLEGQELGNSKIPLCVVKYPQVPSGDLLEEGVDTGQLGKINLVVDADLRSFEPGGDSVKNITVSNSLTVDQIQVPVGPDEPFRPCDLDVDGDGIVSQEDIEYVFSHNPGLMFDVNGDGIVDDQDRVLAREYIGAICNGVTDPDFEDLYEGAFDSEKLTWGHSINRLLKGNHSRKPLFRVVMPVNYFFTGNDYDFTNPDMTGGSSTGDLSFENGRLNPDEVIQNATIKLGYSNYNYLSNIVQKGEILMKDIFWKGSEEQIKQDIISFYEQGKNIQEASGINPDENFYNNSYWKTYLNSVRVCQIYDQSGNGKHGYSTAWGNFNGSYGPNDGIAGIGHEDDTKVAYCPMIYSMGRFFENNNGRISLSKTGYQQDDTNPYGFPEGSVGMNSQPFSSAAITFRMGGGSTDFQRQFCPNTLPGQPVYQYTVADFYVANTRAPFGDYIEGSFNRIDLLRKSFEDAYGLSSFDDIFHEPQDGKLTDEILSFTTPDKHLYQYQRAIFHLNSQTYNINNVTLAGIYIEPSGDSVSLMGSSYTVYQGSQGSAGDIIDPELDAEGNFVWTQPVWKETYQNQFIPTEETAPQYTSGYGANAFAAGYRQGPSDLYLRLKNSLTPNANGDYGDMNRKIGGNQWSQNLTLCLSTRYHTGTYPGLDLRLNNKRQIIYNDSSLTASASFQMPAQCGGGGVRNNFYETVGFEFENEADYERVLNEANEYFNCFPLEDSSRLLDPYTQEDLDAYNNG